MSIMEELAKTRGDSSAFSELVFGTGLHEGQSRYVAQAQADVNFLLPGNSWGKTEFIARRVLETAWWKEGNDWNSFEEWVKSPYKALVASYTYPVAKESFDRLDFYAKNRSEVRNLIETIHHTDPVKVTLTNGSVINWGSLDGQGRLVEAARRNIIFVDEAGHIPDLSATFDNILFPRTMGVGGKIHLLGTPKAHSDPYLLEVYEKGRSGLDPFYYAQGGSVFENQFWAQEERERVLRNPRYVKGWRDSKGEEEQNISLLIQKPGRFPILTPIGRQVVLGHFIIAGGFFFNRLHIQRFFTGTHEGAWHGENFYRVEPIKGHLYMGAWDLGGNRPKTQRKGGSDPTVGVVIDYTTRPWQVVYYNHIEGGDADWEMKYQEMKTTYKDYRLPYLIIDATGQVDSVQEALQNRGVEVEGIHFGGQGNKKFDMLRNLQLALEMEWSGTVGLLRCPPIPKMKYELDHYILPDDNIQQDTVMTLAMVAHHVVQNEVPAAMAGEVW
jgi:hypothetical protein